MFGSRFALIMRYVICQAYLPEANNVPTTQKTTSHILLGIKKKTVGL